MKFEQSIVSSLVLLASTTTTAFAFTTSPSTTNPSFIQCKTTTRTNKLLSSLKEDFEFQGNTKHSAYEYKPGQADSEFARRFGHLSGKEIRTTGEAFGDFTAAVGNSLNSVYKTPLDDVITNLHLTVVNCRFQRDPIWSLGMVVTLDFLLKSYPDPELIPSIKKALYAAVELDQQEIEAEAQTVLDWAKEKTPEDIESALAGEGDGPVAEMAKAAKADRYWLYSRYFGLGLVRIMEIVGVEMNARSTFDTMGRWMRDKLGKPELRAQMDSDSYFRVQSKMDMMETMMKEIAIREKKKMADRLEEKAERAIKDAERDAKEEKELAIEDEKERERKRATKTKIQEMMDELPRE